ncbi:MAG: molybdate ABC transporter permease subunit [Cucumibacter sp.]
MNAGVVEIVFLSLQVAAVAMLWAVPLAYLIAWLLARHDFPGKTLLSALVMLPLVMPPVALGLLLLWGFGPNAPLGQFFASIGLPLAFHWEGAALAAGLVALPLIVRPIRLSLEAVDPKLDEALAVAGHAPLKRFLTLHLPLSLPGIVAGLLLGFAKGLGEFGATITFVANIPGETRTLSLAIHSALQSVSGAPTVLALCLVSIALSVVAVAGSEYLLRWLTPLLTGRTGSGGAEPIRA